MTCGNFFTGSTWVQPTEIHTWNGSSWIRATEVHVYNGAAWVKFFPCVLAGLTASETANILDTAAATKIPRTTIKTALELLVTSESVFVTKRFTVSETANILDTAAATKIAREVVKTALELLVTSETGVISITVLDPIITNCSITGADNDEAQIKARCRFNPGARCESVIVERQINAGGWVFFRNMDTTPSVGPVLSDYYFGLCEEVLDFRIRPFTGDSQTGTEGTACITNSITLGGEGSCGEE